MLARIVFCVVIAAAVLAVVLLATISPLPHRSGGHARPPNPRTLTVYIHPATPTSVQQQHQHQRGAAVHGGEVSALVFRHRMTAGPESTSRTVGAASGFLLPAGEAGAASSVFDMVLLAFDAPGLSGSLCVVEASDEKGRHGRGGEDELRVVGGTGAFAFARGHAVVRVRRPGLGATAAAAALRLELSVSPAAGS